MRDRGGLARDAAIVLRWPVGMALASWRYLWRTSPLHRSDAEGSAEDGGPPVPEDLIDDRMQGVDKGVGPFFRRRYSVRIYGSSMSPEKVIDVLGENLNRAAPAEVAVFRKSQGDEGPLHVGDEYLVRMPGPWDGPVRAIDRTPRSFRFVTLKGHLEAGQIEFRAYNEDSALRFEIESWARSGDRLSELLYVRVRVVKEMQLHMWVHFCERVGRLCGGRVRGGVEIRTRRLGAMPGG